MVVVLGGVGQLIGTVVAAFSIGGLNTFFEYGTSASLGKVLVFVHRHRLPAVAAGRAWWPDVRDRRKSHEGAAW